MAKELTVEKDATIRVLQAEIGRLKDELLELYKDTGKRKRHSLKKLNNFATTRRMSLVRLSAVYACAVRTHAQNGFVSSWSEEGVRRRQLPTSSCYVSVCCKSGEQCCHIRVRTYCTSGLCLRSNWFAPARTAAAAVPLITRKHRKMVKHCLRHFVILATSQDSF